MNEEEDKTMVRRAPIEERTRAVARDVDTTQLRPSRPDGGGHRPESGADPAPVQARLTQAGLARARLARVPGPEVEDARYGVRRHPLTVPVERAASPAPAVASRGPAREQGDTVAPVARVPRRGSAMLVLGVTALAAALVIAAVILVVWITA